MIVYRVWETGNKLYCSYKRWEGWFLFGLIPVYIRQTHYQDQVMRRF